jgi:signal transduction histidine kinase
MTPRPDAPWECPPPGGSWEPGPPWASHRHHRIRHPHQWRSLRRSPDNRVLGGVCGALSHATGIDVTWVRIGFVLLTLMSSGFGLLAYFALWLLIPLEGETTNILSRAVSDRRGIRLLIALVPVLIVVQFVISSLHAGYIGFIGWPTILAVGIGVIIWRNAADSERKFLESDVAPIFGGDSQHRSRRMLVLRVALGVALAIAGAVCLLEAKHPNLASLRPIAGALLLLAALVVILGPWWLGMLRDLIAERQARARAEERAQMAAHVHDSVLQTLALIQRSADDPQHVVRLARSQERELRAWLFEGRPPGAVGEDAKTLAEGVGLLQRQVEEDHGIAVQVVLVGDCPLDDSLCALLDAAKEATVNAAKWSGADQVSLYAEVERDSVMLYVRDRGRGFDPDAVPENRQGIAQSIKARVERFGGRAVIRSAPGEGAEVELSISRRERVR